MSTLSYYKKFFLTFLFATSFLLSSAWAGNNNNVKHRNLGAKLKQIIQGNSPGQGLLFDGYGFHIESDGKWVVVAAPREGPSGLQTGAVYIYRRAGSDLVLHQKIEGEGNNTAFLGDRFGSGVAIQGNTMFISVLNDPKGLEEEFGPDPLNFGYTFAGQVYVYNFNKSSDQWELIQKLTSDMPNTFGSFGGRTGSNPVALFRFPGDGQEPSIALIGEIENNPLFPAVVHVFKKEGLQWNRIQKINSPSADFTNALFADEIVGFKRSAKKHYAMINDTDGNSSSGLRPRVQVYEVFETGISEEPVQTLVAPVGSAPQLDLLSGITPTCQGVSSTFGSYLAAEKKVAVIGDYCYVQDLPEDTTLNFPLRIGTDGMGQPIILPAGYVVSQGEPIPAGAIHIYRINKNPNKPPLTLLQTAANPETFQTVFENASSPGVNVAKGIFYGLNNFAGGKESVSTDGKFIIVGSSSPQPVDVYARGKKGLFQRIVALPVPLEKDLNNFFGPSIGIENSYGHSVELLGRNELAISQLFFPITSADASLDPVIRGAVYVYKLNGKGKKD